MSFVVEFQKHIVEVLEKAIICCGLSIHTLLHDVEQLGSSIILLGVLTHVRKL